MDKLSKELRSWNMSRIRCSDTKPELLVRSVLFKLGYRYRLYSQKLPGKPDIVISKYKTVIFVHGCFWHRHEFCKFAYTPKSRVEFWQSKFMSNIDRDIIVKHKLEESGWKVVIIWECQTKNADELSRLIRSYLN